MNREEMEIEEIYKKLETFCKNKKLNIPETLEDFRLFIDKLVHQGILKDMKILSEYYILKDSSKYKDKFNFSIELNCFDKISKYLANCLNGCQETLELLKIILKNEPGFYYKLPSHYHKNIDNYPKLASIVKPNRLVNLFCNEEVTMEKIKEIIGPGVDSENKFFIEVNSKIISKILSYKINNDGLTLSTLKNIRKKLGILNQDKFVDILKNCTETSIKSLSEQNETYLLKSAEIIAKATAEDAYLTPLIIILRNNFFHLTLKR